MTHTAEDWPIGALMLNFAGASDGVDLTSSGRVDLWRRDLREVALAGFTHVDLMDSWVRPADLSPEQRKTLVATAADQGLQFSVGAIARKSVITADREQAKANFEYALRSIDAIAELGAGVVCVGLHEPLLPAQQSALWFWLADGTENPDDPETWELCVERFRAMGERAGSHGMTLSLEMYEGTYLGTSESSVRLCRDINLPNVGLCPDIGNIVRLHRPVEDWRTMITAMAPYSNYWQTKNYLRDYDPATGAYFSAPAPMENGFINYRESIGIAIAAGFSGPFGVENYGGDGLSVCATNRDYIRRILAAKLDD